MGPIAAVFPLFCCQAMRRRGGGLLPQLVQDLPGGGGHAQAAGVNVTAENFEALKAALDEYIGSHYEREDFVPTLPVAGRAKGDFKRVARELTLLEPCGMGNRKPLFFAEADSIETQPIKPGSQHLAMNVGGIDLVYFNGYRNYDVLTSDLHKKLVFEYNVSRYKGKEYVKGFVRTVVYDGMSGSSVELEGFENALRCLSRVQNEAEIADMGSLNAFIEEKLAGCAYGLCAVVHDRRSLRKFPVLRDLEVDVFRPSSGSAANCVLFAPAPDCNLSAFREIVCLDFPAALPETGNARILLNGELAGMGACKHVSCVREDLLSTFAALRRAEGCETGRGYAEAARALHLTEPPEQVVFALAVFEELGLLTLAQGRLELARGKRTELGNSRIYRAVMRLKEGL